MEFHGAVKRFNAGKMTGQVWIVASSFDYWLLMRMILILYFLTEFSMKSLSPRKAAVAMAVAAAFSLTACQAPAKKPMRLPLKPQNRLIPQ